MLAFKEVLPSYMATRLLFHPHFQITRSNQCQVGKQWDMMKDGSDGRMKAVKELPGLQHPNS